MSKVLLIAALVFPLQAFIAANESAQDEGTTALVPVEGQPYAIVGFDLPMVWIEPGTFKMGSPKSERHRHLDERLHLVTLSRGFWLGECEVTVAQWEFFVQSSGYLTEAECGDGISQWIRGQWKRVPGSSWKDVGFAQTATHPVVGISWNDAMKFCDWLTEHERGAGRLSENLRYTLPTEAQWEYACRAGYDGPYFPDVKNLNDESWFRFGDGIGGILAEDNTHPTGTRRINAWGLHDVHGNVFEWCRDWYIEELEDNVIDPEGPESGTERVCRGGAWSSYSKYIRSATRGRDVPTNRGNNLGFRVSLSEIW
jgi:formylglycine-generating enzyme required for sulfatase activity